MDILPCQIEFLADGGAALRLDTWADAYMLLMAARNQFESDARDATFRGRRTMDAQKADRCETLMDQIMHEIERTMI